MQEVGDLFLLTKDTRLLEYLIATIAKCPTNTVLDIRLDFLRSQVSKIIVRSRSNKTISLLLKQLNSNYWIVRYWSVQTLGDMGDKSAIKILNKLLSDEKELVILATQRALNNLQKPQDNQQLITKNKRPQHLNHNNLIEETDRLMKQLNYTVSEGKNYLRKHFNKHSRHHLKPHELFAFRDYLQNKLEEKNLNQVPDFSTTITQSDCNNVEVIKLEFKAIGSISNQSNP